MKPYRILVTGSRKWTDAASVRRELTAFFRREMGIRSDLTRDYVLVHGAAKGLDSIAAEAAEGMARELHLALTTEPHPADWTTYGNRAGPIRNAEMVALGADICLAFPTAGSVGTWDCVRKANAAGIRVVIVPGR